MSDDCDQEKQAQAPINAQGSSGFVYAPSAPVHQDFGEKRDIATQGGDYSEGDFHKTINNIERQVVYQFKADVTKEHQLSRDDQHRWWKELIEQLCELNVNIGEEVLFCMQSSFWPMLKWPSKYSNTAELFRNVIWDTYEYRPRDHSDMLAFVLLLAKEATPADSGSLLGWAQKACNALNIERDTVEQLASPYWSRYLVLRNKPASLMIVIREEQPESSYSVEMSLVRPDLAERPLGERLLVTKAETMQTLRKLLGTAVSGEWPHWLGRELWIEFILPESLLLQLSGEWQFDRWEYEEYSQVRKRSAEWLLGARYPIVLRCTERLFMSEWEPFREIWKTKAAHLAAWLHAQARSQDETPVNAKTPVDLRVTCTDSSHRCYLPAAEWRYEGVVAMVVPASPPSPTAEVYQEMMFSLLEHGLPVGLWLVPGADVVSPQEHMEHYLAAARLRDLPRHIQAERAGVTDRRSPAANLVLFWDEVDRQPPEWPFSAPRRRA